MQQREMLYLPFFVLYFLEWLFRLILYRSPMKAYFSISMEREAYRNDDKLDYIQQRGFWAWRHHLLR